MANGSLKVLTLDVRLGMFIEDLDRPWLDTPFLIQGFLLEDDSDIGTLRQLCRYVYVDPVRSTVPVPRTLSMVEGPVATEHAVPSGMRPVQVVRTAPRTQGAKPAAASPRPRVVREHRPLSDPRRPAREKDATNVAARQIVFTASRSGAKWRPVDPGQPASPDAPAGASAGTLRFNPLSRLKGLFQDLADMRREAGRPSDPRPDVEEEHRPEPSIAPPGVQLVVYRDEVPIHQELPRAEQSYKRAREILDRLAQDMRTGTRVDVEGVDEVVNDMVDSMIASPDALMWIARMRQQHSDVYSHGVQVGVYLLALGRHLGFPKTQLGYLGTMGLLLDLGKTALPRGLLEKPGRLTDDEFALVKRHVEYGLEVVSSGPKALHPDVLEGIAQHHERLNGRGYPYGLQGEDIGVYGRMSGIADCFAAVTSPRPYADTLSVSDAMMRLYEWGGELFAQPLVEKLVQAIGVFPVGSLVELSSGEVAVVIRHNRVRRLQPKVLVIADAHKQPLRSFQTLDLLTESEEWRGGRVRVCRGLPSGAYGLDTSTCYLSAT